VNGGGIDGGGDIHEFQAEISAWEFQFADVADKGDVGIVDGDRKIGLVRQSRRLIPRSIATGILSCAAFFLPA